MICPAAPHPACVVRLQRKSQGLLLEALPVDRVVPAGRPCGVRRAAFQRVGHLAVRPRYRFCRVADVCVLWGNRTMDRGNGRRNTCPARAGEAAGCRALERHPCRTPSIGLMSPRRAVPRRVEPAMSAEPTQALKRCAISARRLLTPRSPVSFYLCKGHLHGYKRSPARPPRG